MLKTPLNQRFVPFLFLFETKIRYNDRCLKLRITNEQNAVFITPKLIQWEIIYSFDLQSPDRESAASNEKCPLICASVWTKRRMYSCVKVLLYVFLEAITPIIAKETKKKKEKKGEIEKKAPRVRRGARRIDINCITEE